MYVARGDVLVDTIPLHEIISVEEMKDDPDTARNTQTTLTTAMSTERSVSFSETASSRNMASDKDQQKKNASKSSRQSILQVKTALDGFNFGRIYYLKPSIRSSGANIVRHLLGAVSTAKAIVERKSRFQKSQEMVRGVQESLAFQIMVAILIILVREPPHFDARPHSAHTRRPSQNFLLNAVEAQIVDEIVGDDGRLSELGAALEHVDALFTALFTAELAINAYAHWFRAFAMDGWNLFDSVVVSLSLVALGPIDMPISVLRSVRAFRVVRLFGRMGALRDIIASLTAAIVPVLNAFLVMLIVSSICEPS
jgi:hypothetical protein